MCPNPVGPCRIKSSNTVFFTGRYDCAARGDNAGMGNDEKGCYVFEYSNGFLFIVCALSFIIRDWQNPATHCYVLIPPRILSKSHR